MSVVPALFNGLNGNKDANTLNSLPSTGAPNDCFNKPDLKLNWYTLKGPFPTCMKQAVLNPNLGGQRGVKPCKGVNTARYTLRRPAIPQEGAFYPHTGFTRGQRPGLASQKQFPTNLPIMPTASSFNAGLPNSIPNLAG